MGQCYKKNFVKQVVSKLDFMTQVDLFSSPAIIEGLDEIKKRFPIAEQGKATQQNIQLGPDGVTSSKNEFPEWIFNSSDRKRTLKINKLFLEVVLNSYSSENDLKSDLIIPATQILKAQPQLIVQRTGIRFVNVFDFQELTLENSSQYFADSITAHISSIDPMKNLSRSFNINEFFYEDMRIRQQSGFFNPDYPAIIRRPHFVLDFDAYIDFPHQIGNTEEHFTKLHDKIEEHFEKCLKEKLRIEVLNA